MGTLSDFEKYKEEHTPTLSGTIRCLVCQKTWVGVAPVACNAIGLECPACHCMKGVFENLVFPKKEIAAFVCACENKLYWILENYIMCPICGRETEICGPGSHDQGPKRCV